MLDNNSDRYGSSARVTSSEHAASAESQTSSTSASPIAVNSSILSVPLSNIDLNRILGRGMEANSSPSSSGSDSTPRVPWNMRTGTRNAGGNTLVTQSYKLATSTPHLTHVEWRNLRNDPRRQRRELKGKEKRMHKSDKATMEISRDFFLLIALCIGLACALICLARPLITPTLA